MKYEEDQPKKSLGQHWLYDQDSLQAMIEAADINSEDIVLEIGPGLGTLTKLLVKEAKEVYAIELDEKLAASLPKKVPANNLTVIQGDILRLNFSDLPKGYKVVANIPYYISSHLIRVLSEAANPPSTAALLVQKEVAQRINAKPGDMSLLSITSQYYFETSLGLIVPAELFDPPPKVDSQIVILKRRQAPLYPDIDMQKYFQLIKAGFSQKRKTLLNTITNGMHIERSETSRLLQKTGIEENRRAQSLSQDEWYTLYKSLYS
jgi:16S rRNA (adenine1518-N6/adenine1519-N6)-dimethyltransferase